LRSPFTSNTLAKRHIESTDTHTHTEDQKRKKVFGRLIIDDDSLKKQPIGTETKRVWRERTDKVHGLRANERAKLIEKDFESKYGICSCLHLSSFKFCYTT
jgi:hypothetical protein